MTDDASVVVRLLSYNVRSLRDDAAAVAAVMSACTPDVVCIQEAPRFLRWRSKCAALAREAGLVVVTGGRTAGAMLLLCRLGVDVRWRSDVLLSKTPGLHQRGLAVAGLRLRRRDFVVASFHLGLRGDERLRHVEEIASRLRGADAPTVLAGDVNERPGEPAWSALTVRWRDGYAVAPSGDGNTYSARQPTKRIDGVFADPSVEVLSCGVPDVDGLGRASDHRPVLALLRLG
jgi:endonuclease/exonuclease/phosphatase family metal-dependent hydrolase